MSKPTPLSPWFVIMRLDAEGPAKYLVQRFYSEENGDGEMMEDRTAARLFNSLHTAYRLAAAYGGYVIALADEAALKEFRPRGL